MAASLTDKFRKTVGFSTTTLDGSITDSSTTFDVDSAPSWPTDTAMDIVVDRVDAQGDDTPNTREVMTVTNSGGTLTTDNTRRGLDGTTRQAHNASAVVEVNFTADTWNDHIDGLLVSLDQDGTLKAGAVDNAAALASSVVTTPKMKPTTAYYNSPGAGDLTTNSTSYVDKLTVFTHIAGATAERVVVDLYVAGFNTSAGAAAIRLNATGTGVTVRMQSVARNLTVSSSGAVSLIFDITAGNTATVVLQARNVTAGTTTINNTNTDDLSIYGKLVSYGNA